MNSIFAPINLDFMFLFMGASFFFLGTACLRLYFHDRSKESVPWIFLSICAFALSVNFWLDAAGLVFMKPALLETQRSIFISVAFLTFFAFCRRSLVILKRVKISVWIYLPLMLGLAYIFQTRGISTYSRALIQYSIFLPLAILCGYVFWLFGLRSKRAFQRKTFKFAGIIYFLLSLEILIFIYTARINPLGIISPSYLFVYTGIQIRVFFSVLIMFLALLLNYEATGELFASRGFSRSVKKVRLIQAFFIILFTIILVTGFIFLQSVQKHEQKHLESTFLSDARLLAATFNEPDIGSLNSKKSFSQYTQYLATHRQLLELTRLSNFAKQTYLVTWEAGVPVFLVGSQNQVYPKDINFQSLFESERLIEVIRDAFNSGEPTVYSSYLDPLKGPVYSLFIPIPSKVEDGAPMILGIDLDGAQMHRHLGFARLAVLSVVLAFFVLLIVGHAFLVIFALRGLELETQKDDLKDALVKLSETKSELARSEEVFRGIISNSPNALFGFDRDEKAIFWNHGSEKLYGYLKDDVVNEKNPVLSNNIVEQLDLEDKADKFSAVFKGEVIHFECVQNKKSGERMDTIITLFPVKDQKGHILFGMGVVQDISKSRKMERALTEERDRLGEIAESIGAGLSLIDKDMNIIWANEKCVSWFGKFGVLVGRKCFQVCQFREVSCDDCPSKKAMQTGKIQSVERVSNMPDGRTMYFLTISSPVRNDKGEVEQVLEMRLDITEQKRLEHELRQYTGKLKDQVTERTAALKKSELMFSKLFESAQDGILILDAQSGRIIDINPYLSKLLDFDRNKAKGIYWLSLPGFSGSREMRQVLTGLEKSSSVYFDDIVLILPVSDREIDVEFLAAFYISEGKKVVQCNIRDITEKKKVDKIKSDFVSMVSHELRTPLSAINEGVQIVADGTLGNLSDEQKECLDITLFNIKRLNRLIGDILDISKIQSNLINIIPLPCNVYEIAEQVKDLLTAEVDKRGLRFSLNLPEDLPQVFADKDRLIQVLMNLLNNAVKFSKEKSSIILSCKRAQEFVEFSISDEGAGISKEQMNHLFTKFSQLDSTLARRTEGTGLGLYISRNLVDAMGGKIWAESILGKGSVFKFTIPVWSKENEPR